MLCKEGTFRVTSESKNRNYSGSIQCVNKSRIDRIHTVGMADRGAQLAAVGSGCWTIPAAWYNC
jgi:hypothetical protein